MATTANRWSEVLGASANLARAIKFGIRYFNSVPFTVGEILPLIPQNKEHQRFVLPDLEDRMRSEVYAEMSRVCRGTGGAEPACAFVIRHML